MGSIETVRRRILQGVLASTVMLAFAGTGSAQTSAAERELMTKVALPDIVQGNPDAPVTIVEYASLTCTHCAQFHETVYPTILKKYVETGKVKFILREFPRDPLDMACFMLARYEGADKRVAMVDLLFAQQKNWAFTDKPLEALQTLLKQTGMSQATFEACLRDQTLYDQVAEVRDRGARTFGIHGTPTFFVNGMQVQGEPTVETFAKTLDPLLARKG